MSDETGYNGWTNYETWCVNLWMTNDEWTQDHWNDQAQEAWDKYEDVETRLFDSMKTRIYQTQEEHAVSDLSETLENAFSDSFPDLGCSVWSDMLTASFSAVDWREIARALIETIKDAVEV